MLIDHISVSRVSLFLQCQRAYSYKYDRKIKILEEEPFYFIFGNILHRIAQVAVETKKPINEVAKLIIEGNEYLKIENGKHIYAPKIPPEYMKRLPEHLRSLQHIIKQLGTNGITEHEFLYDLDPPNNRCVNGFIDLLVKKDDGYIIVDYKTSKKNTFYRKNRSNVSKDLQLKTYAMVTSRMFNVDPKKVSAFLYYLEGGNLIGAKFSEASLNETHDFLLNTYKQIEDIPYEKSWGNVGDWCTKCQYKSICPFYKMT